MYWFYSKGEGLMDRIEYEEWALKAIIEDQGLRIAKEGELQEVVEVGQLYSICLGGEGGWLTLR